MPCSIGFPEPAAGTRTPCWSATRSRRVLTTRLSTPPSSRRTSTGHAAPRRGRSEPRDDDSEGLYADDTPAGGPGPDADEGVTVRTREVLVEYLTRVWSGEAMTREQRTALADRLWTEHARLPAGRPLDDQAANNVSLASLLGLVDAAERQEVATILSESAARSFDTPAGADVLHPGRRPPEGGVHTGRFPGRATRV